MTSHDTVRRSAATWVALLVVWLVGLLVWVAYLGAIGFLIVRALS